MPTRPLSPNPALRSLILLALTQACAAQSTPAPNPPEPDGEQPTTANPGFDPASEPPKTEISARGAGPVFTPCSREDWLPGKAVAPREPVDGLATRAWHKPDDKRFGGEVAAELCTAASDAEACNKAVDALEPGALLTTTGQIGQIDTDLVYSRGDEVGRIASRAELVDFLGPIDTDGEARLLAWVDGYQPACDREVTQTGRGWDVVAVKRVNDCPVTIDSFELLVQDDGQLSVAKRHPGEESGACIGRLPPGMDEPVLGQEVGGWLAGVAELEAAAVLAFDQLIAELEHHGAPEELVSAARSAREDELRHAAIFTTLAVSWGTTPRPVDAAPHPIRDLVEIGRDNAREGLVRERYGAALGLWQARHAATDELRAAFREVALDEVRHAELSVALDDWIRTRLDDAALQRVDAALAEARRRPMAPSSPEGIAILGLPTPDVAEALRRAVLRVPGPDQSPTVSENPSISS